MNRYIAWAVVLLFVVDFAQAQQPAAPAAGPRPEFKTLKDRVSYMIGLNIGRQLQGDKMDIDQELIIRGLRDALTGATPALSKEEMDAAFTEFQQQQMAEEQAKAALAADVNGKQEAEFLAANAKKEGVVVLPSGMQYKVLKAGTGPSPKATDTVQTHYTGKLLDGTVFDSSVERGQPAAFPVNRVIAGWTEALQKMKAGDKWELYIPSKLAYGAQGSPPVIPPHSMLIFEVELLSVQPNP